MDIIVKANIELFNRREYEMCQALFDIYKDDLMEMAEAKALEKQKKYIINLMNNAHFTLEQALDVLMIPEEERKLYNLS